MHACNYYFLYNGTKFSFEILIWNQNINFSSNKYNDKLVSLLKKRDQIVN